MNKTIKIAGIGLDWEESFAYLYKGKLMEIEYQARVILYNNKYYVGYSYNNFTESECIQVLETIINGGKEFEKI